MVEMTDAQMSEMERRFPLGAPSGTGSDCDPDGVLNRTPSASEGLISRLAFAKLDAEHALEKLTRIMTARGDLSGVCNTSQGTWVYVPNSPKRILGRPE